ncbi:MAG: hypothetical protein ACRC3I_11865 [Cetobacterium sp.]
MNETILKIMITFFPGIIATSVLQFFNPRNKKYSSVEFTLYSFVYGVIISIGINHFFNTGLDFSLNSLPDKNELVLSFFVAFFVGITSSFLRNCGLFHAIAHQFHISYESGFENALDFIYKSSFKNAKLIRKSYVNVKLLDGSATYYGEIVVQESHSDYVELVLKNVSIFFKNNPKDVRYEQDAVFLQLVPGTFFIDFAFDEVEESPLKLTIKKGVSIYLILLFINAIYSYYKNL